MVCNTRNYLLVSLLLLKSMKRWAFEPEHVPCYLIRKPFLISFSYEGLRLLQALIHGLWVKLTSEVEVVLRLILTPGSSISPNSYTQWQPLGFCLAECHTISNLQWACLGEDAENPGSVLGNCIFPWKRFPSSVTLAALQVQYTASALTCLTKHPPAPTGPYPVDL